MIHELPQQLNDFKHMNDIFETLYYIGNTQLLQKKKIAIVGTRRPNAYTKTMTHNLASKLSHRGICIVSGAAMGVDAIAHQAAKNTNTIAVVANGLDIRYPAVNRRLIQTIEKKGLMLSPFECKQKARSYHFVQRNELVVALCDLLIITQADLNSGSLTSAKFALKHNKPIYVLPHRITESLGTQQLLEKYQAQTIYNIDSFVNQFGEEQNEEDEILTYFQSNPTYEQAYSKHAEKLLEYELAGRISINNGIVTVV